MTDMTNDLPAQDLKPTQGQLESACLSYRHDFGLMGETERNRLMWEAKEWLHAWQKEFAIPAAPPADVARVVKTPLTQAARDVLAERTRQIKGEGRTREHDDKNQQNEMATAAACYCLSASGWQHTALWEIWPKPWGIDWFKPTDSRRDLVKAAALILAEIERLDRATTKAVTHD